MSWIKDIVDPKARQWEEFYRNRWQFDRIVRSTHGVNCTGGCSWGVYVKDGLVTWELQMLDYPIFNKDIPPYEPRGCQRGISASWYVYSPIRVKYPYVRGKLLNFWREAKKKYGDPVEAWASIVEDPEKRKAYQWARGKGGFKRSTWDEALEIIASAMIYTIKKYGPDRIFGFSPIPAMSMFSFAGGARFFSLLGGAMLSFYDWYCDLPPSHPEIWGEQTDVCESANWYEAAFIAICGSNLNMTRTPDVHYVAEAKNSGSKLVVFSPDFSQVSKYSDWWIPIKPGEDGAFWMAVNHVVLKEFHHEKKTPYFLDYVKNYTDAPFLVILEEKDGVFMPGRYLRANRIERYKDVENGDWKLLVWDAKTNSPRMPNGTLGFRWGKEKGKWNLLMKDGMDGSDIDPVLTFLEGSDDVLTVGFHDFVNKKLLKRGVPVKYVETVDGKRVAVATVYDLMMAQFGVDRGLPGDYPKSYDEDAPYTPAWQEKRSGISKDTCIQFAREWATTAERTNGKCMIIVGPGLNHWYHNNLIYRSQIVTLMITGCVGTIGGGHNHYVGQEKLAPFIPWAHIAFALDWVKPPRQQNTPSWHYVHSCQWRYDDEFTRYHTTPEDNELSKGHAMDIQVKAVRLGWLPWYPQFNKNTIELVKEAEANGAKTNEEIVQYVVQQLKEKKIRFTVEDPDAPENWPRVWVIWRGNAIGTSAKGHEFFLKHYLGTHSAAIAEESAKGKVKEVVWRDPAPEGKMDLVVDLNFRMDTSALYSDVVLPAAFWYEKNDLNSTDLHSYIHPLGAAVPPPWEAKPDWDIFRELARKVSEIAKKHLPQPVKDIVAAPLAHDTPDELAQPNIKDWAKGECEPIPGKTMPKLVVVERDYVNLYNRFISFGPVKELAGHGIHYSIEDVWNEFAEKNPVEWGGKKYPSLYDTVDAANFLLATAPETCGEMAYRAFKAEEEKTGLKLTDLAEESRDVRYTFDDLVAQPRRLLTSPTWSGDMTEGKPYSPYTINVSKRLPWRTLSGRQHFYLDHEGYISFGENLPTYKPNPTPEQYGDIDKTKIQGKTKLVRYLTPHGKWHIHSTYMDNHRMLTLSRGMEPIWLSEEDARELGINDNDWVELVNDNGVYVARAAVSARIPKGVCFVYHAVERTISIPISKTNLERKVTGKRGGMNNSVTRTKVKPVLMFGGYAQFTYAMNYWGPTGVNRDTYVYIRKYEGPVIW